MYNRESGLRKKNPIVSIYKNRLYSFADIGHKVFINHYLVFIANKIRNINEYLLWGGFSYTILVQTITVMSYD